MGNVSNKSGARSCTCEVGCLDFHMGHFGRNRSLSEDIYLSPRDT